MKKTEEEISKKATELFPEVDRLPRELGYHENDLAHHSQMAFIEGAKWMQEQDNWISVEDRLPEKYQRVTILEWTNGLTYPSVLQGSYEGDRWRLYGGHTAEKVTHWQPLPKSPSK